MKGDTDPDLVGRDLSLQPRTYVLAELWAPDGYLPAPDRTFSIIAGQPTVLTVANSLGR